MAAPVGTDGEPPVDGLDPRLVTLSPPLEATHPKSMVLIFYVSTMLCVLAGWGYVQMVGQWWWLIFLLPVELLGFAYIFVISSLLMAKIATILLNRRHPPAEGVFPRNSKHVRAMLARDFFRHYAIWLARNSTFPWIDKIAYSLFGVYVGRTVVLHEAWVDPELVEVGDYCMIGMNAVVMSRCMYAESVVVKKTRIASHSIIGAYTVVAPGTAIGNHAVIGANSSTVMDQVVDGGHLHAGNPSRKLKVL